MRVTNLCKFPCTIASDTIMQTPCWGGLGNSFLEGALCQYPCKNKLFQSFEEVRIFHVQDNISQILLRLARVSNWTSNVMI